MSSVNVFFYDWFKLVANIIASNNMIPCAHYSGLFLSKQWWIVQENKIQNCQFLSDIIRTKIKNVNDQLTTIQSSPLTVNMPHGAEIKALKKYDNITPQKR